MLSHEELVAELPKLEKYNASERKKINDNRRAAQLERWKKSQSEGNCDHSTPSIYRASIHRIPRLDLF
jgi:hypothetical protein